MYQITSTNFELSKANTALVSIKLKKIERHIQTVGVDLKEIRVICAKGEKYGFLVKIELFIPGKTFVAKSAGFRFESAVDGAIEELALQLNKHKGKVYGRKRAMIRNLKHSLFFSHLSDEI